MHKHVQLLGILYIVYHAFGLIIAWLIWGVLSGVGMISGDPNAAMVLGLVGTVVATLFFVLSAPGVLAGVGLLKEWWWARYLALVLGFLNLIHIPLGTILGVYTFWVLMQDETMALFEADAPSAPAAPPEQPAT